MNAPLPACRQSMSKHYRRCLKQPIAIITTVLMLCGLAIYHARDFTFDASADTLISKNDPELIIYRSMVKNFGDAPFLVLTYTPRKGPLLIPRHLQKIKQLEAALLELDGIKSLTSILDAPLLRSPPMPISELAKGFNNLRKGGVDLALAEKELTSSPLFKELLISADGRTTVIRIDLVEDEALEQIRTQRDQLDQQPMRNADQQARLETLQDQYNDQNERDKAARQALIADIRALRDRESDDAQIYLGGVPMVAADMIDFIRSDMLLFGAGILALTLISLWVFFRRLRWVLIPLGTTAVTLLLMIGLLGYLKQPATAISSNFISLLAIITISFTIHLIVRYRELRLENFSDDHSALVFEAMRSKLAPCIYTGLTTGVAFASLLTSDIKPVIDFGWIMCVGIAVSFLVTYSFFASILVLLPKGKASATLNRQPTVTLWLGTLTLNNAGALIAIAGVSLLIGLYGISKVSLDNRFIEYFKVGSEIRDGMTFIDRKLGGTIPLDIVIDVPPFSAADSAVEDDPFAAVEAESFPEKYWYTPDKIRILADFQRYLDSRDELGKTLSLSSLEMIARDFNEGKALDTLQLVAVLNAIPEDLRNALISPYASPHTGELRISSRLHETGPAFSREALIRDIERYAVDELGLQPDAVHVTGMTVLFNGMLNQLFSSQTSTLVFVLLATLIMFTLLLRSLTLGLLGLAPNILAAVVIMAFMGFAGIPLDMMTITIAAIVIGIGVDDAIHYLHRFKEERDAGASAREAVDRSHRSIGNALYYTSVTVIIGFSVLAFSNFVPTLYFGVLTALAMLLALLANLTVLPALLLKVYR